MLESILKDTMVTMKWTDIQEYSNKNALVLLPLGVIEGTWPTSMFRYGYMHC